MTHVFFQAQGKPQQLMPYWAPLPRQEGCSLNQLECTGAVLPKSLPKPPKLFFFFFRKLSNAWHNYYAERTRWGGRGELDLHPKKGGGKRKGECSISSGSTGDFAGEAASNWDIPERLLWLFRPVRPALPVLCPATVTRDELGLATASVSKQSHDASEVHHFSSDKHATCFHLSM